MIGGKTVRVLKLKSDDIWDWLENVCQEVRGGFQIQKWEGRQGVGLTYFITTCIAITEYHRLWLKQQKSIFSQLCTLEVQNQGVGRFGFLWGLSPWLVDGCLLTMSSHGHPLCMHIPDVPLCVHIPSSFFFSFFKKFTFFYLFIYLFLAVLGLRFCARAFSSCGERGPLFIVVRGPLTVAASRCGAQALDAQAQ